MTEDPQTAAEERGERTAASSELRTVTLMTPDMSNFSGSVHGGHVLRLIDQIAYACASSYSASYAVTASVDRVDFRVPVRVGELLSLAARVNYVGRTSMEVGVRAEARDLRTGETRHTNSCFLTMIALDDARRPTPVPRLVCETDLDRRRFADGARRRQRARLLRLVEESEQRFSELIERADVAMLLAAAEDAQVVDGNRLARQLLGYDEPGLAARTVHDLQAPDDRAAALAFWKQVRASGFGEASLRHHTATGELLALRVTSWVVPSPGRDLVQWVLRPLGQSAE